MARNLLKANVPVTVLDINPASVDALKKAGATSAGKAPPCSMLTLSRALRLNTHSVLHPRSPRSQRRQRRSPLRPT